VATSFTGARRNYSTHEQIPQKERPYMMKRSLIEFVLIMLFADGVLAAAESSPEREV
jgi:hypothetical protein